MASEAARACVDLLLPAVPTARFHESASYSPVSSRMFHVLETQS